MIVAERTTSGFFLILGSVSMVDGGVVLWETVDHFSFSWRQRHDGQDEIGCLLKKGEYEESDEAWASSAAPESINRGSSDIESTARAAEVRGRQ